MEPETHGDALIQAGGRAIELLPTATLSLKLNGVRHTGTVAEWMSLAERDHAEAMAPTMPPPVSLEDRLDQDEAEQLRRDLVTLLIVHRPVYDAGDVAADAALLERYITTAEPPKETS